MRPKQSKSGHKWKELQITPKLTNITKLAENKRNMTKNTKCDQKWQKGSKFSEVTNFTRYDKRTKRIQKMARRLSTSQVLQYNRYRYHISKHHYSGYYKTLKRVLKKHLRVKMENRSKWLEVGRSARGNKCNMLDFVVIVHNKDPKGSPAPIAGLAGTESWFCIPKIFCCVFSGKTVLLLLVAYIFNGDDCTGCMTAPWLSEEWVQ